MADSTRGFFTSQTAIIGTDTAGPFRIGCVPHISIEVPAAANALGVTIQTRDVNGTLVDVVVLSQGTGRIRGLSVNEDNVVSTLDEIYVKFSTVGAAGGTVKINQRS